MMKDKMKDFMKKVTSSSSSSASSFKGPSHVLGSASGPAPAASHPASRSSNPSPNPRPAAPRQPQPPAPAPRPPATEFTPFAPLISTTPAAASSRRPAAEGAAAAVACPSCEEAFPSETAVAEHLDGCLASAGGARPRAAAFLAADPPPPPAAVEVLKRLLGNLLREPANDKYRRVRLGNPRIKEAVADRKGGLELLEAVGFRVGDEGGELFAVMDEVPGDAKLGGIRRAVLLLERACPSAPPAQVEAEAKESRVDEQAAVKKTIDRQIRVFFSVPGSSVPENDVPDSFYNLSGEEIRNEAKMRRERLEQSRLLIPKSYKEKQALAARQKYKQAVIRVQFPDRVILQGVFLPGEATGSLYEFVASALKQPGLEFELICPAVPKPRVVPHFPKPGERARTLQDEDLVPSALLKFKPKETDSVVFTGLLDELLQASEPLTGASS
ncbi:hypothetical protein ACP4OV_024044 [Aristida adscensionis]